MRLSILVAFVAIISVSSAGRDTEAWGVAQTGQSYLQDAVKPHKSVDDVVEDYHTVHNREQWEILKTKQQRLRTGKVQLEKLHQKYQEKTGRAYPDKVTINAIEDLMNYRPSDFRILGDVNHLPLDKTSSSKVNSPRGSSYGSQTEYGYSGQAYGSKPNPTYQASYGSSNQVSGRYSPSAASSIGSVNQAPVSNVQSGVYPPGTGSYYNQVGLPASKAQRAYPAGQQKSYGQGNYPTPLGTYSAGSRSAGLYNIT